MNTRLADTVLARPKARAGNGEFDPFRSLFLASAERPAPLRPLEPHSLTPFQRALLVTDGTVTHLIEAYAFEPVEVLRLRQESEVLHDDHPWLETGRGTPVVVREVVLRGRMTRRVYVHAVSLLVPERLSAEIRRGLEVDEGGLGRILLASRIENRRELLWYGREVPAELPPPLSELAGTAFISRTYRIIAGGRPAMLITERFPAGSKK